jgi:hypothetical protein
MADALSVSSALATLTAQGWVVAGRGTAYAPNSVFQPNLSSSQNNTTLLAAVVASMSAGQTMLLPEGIYTGDITTTKGIRILGSGRARKSGAALVNGTILTGQITIQDAVGVEVGNLGIDQTGLTPGSYPNGITGGMSTLNDSTTIMDQYVHDVVLLGRGYTGGTNNSQHGVLFQNGRGFLCERVAVYKYLNGLISRASGASFSNSYVEDSESNAVFFKSGSVGGSNDCFDNEAINVTGKATADGFFANFGSFAEDNTKKARNNKFVGCTADASGTTSGQATFYAQGTTNIDSNRGALFVGCTSKGDRSGNAFLVSDAFSEGVAFVGCNAEDFGGFSFRSNATGATNLPSVIGGTCWRTGFADIINANGLWAMCEINGKSFDSGGSRTVATLPTASIFASARFIVTDANATTYNSIVAGGGANIVPVYSDGTNWRIG